FFDPCEGAEPPFDRLVPRDVDVFVRREALASDFTVFPHPVLAERLVRTKAWRELSQTGLYQRLAWPGELEALSASIEQQLQQAPLDPLRDVLGSEVAVVGRLAPKGAGEAQFALMARITN